MKKVALMTWFQHDNFGTTLQSVATTCIIKNMGYDIDGIDYKSKGYDRLTKLEKILNPILLKDKIKRDFEYKKYHKKSEDPMRSKAFDDFRHKHLSMTRSLQTSSELNLLNKEYDAFICGSDQIWSPREFNPKYYLDFVAVQEKKIAYAPSFGRSVIRNPFTRRRIAENINTFKHLSVREEQGATLIKEITNKESQVFIDPTLLITSKEWDEYLIDIKTPNKYILCYFLGDNKKHWKHVEAISKKHGLEVLVIPTNPKDFHRGYSALKGIGPGEFLSLVKKATLVCTDSFHGTIFSVIYNRPILVYKRFIDKNEESQNSRIYNLLKLIDLEERLVDNFRINVDQLFSVDYTKVFSILEKERKKSFYYLEGALSDAFEHSYDENDYEITNTCCGCSVCANVCRQNAIDIKLNSFGFYEATINHDKCTRCGLCRKVCSFNGYRGEEIDKKENSLYMLRSNSNKVLATSTSGGAAYEISKFLSMKGYDVIGCTYDKEKASAYHKKISSGDINLLSSFQGSKYIQSNTIEAFKNILDSHKAVVFGTPCQIAGLDNFLRLKGRRDNYILVELICHGIPSIHLWHKYLKEGALKYEYGNMPDVHFRYKKMGWKKKYMYIRGNGKIYLKHSSKDMFYRYFELQNCLMPSCYECNYRTSSKADIRLGDYWGDKYNKYKETGASMVISMTSVGDLLLKQLKEEKLIELIQEELSDYRDIQYPENPIKPVYYEELIIELNESELSLRELLNKYFKIEDMNKRLAVPYGKLRKIIKLR